MSSKEKQNLSGEAKTSICGISGIQLMDGMLPGLVNVRSKMAMPGTGGLFLSPPVKNISLAQSLLEEERGSFAEKSDQSRNCQAENGHWEKPADSSDLLPSVDLQAGHSFFNRSRCPDSAEETFHSCQSVSVDSIEEKACSVVTSSSSCLDDSGSFLIMDAMNDSSGTSSDDESGIPDDSRANVSSFPFFASSSVFLSPSPSVGMSQRFHANQVSFLATSTPKPMVSPRCGNQERYKEKQSLPLDEYSKIKMLAASMPSTEEEQRRIIPVLRGLSPLEANAALLIRRPLAEGFLSPISKVRTISSLQTSGDEANSRCNSRQIGFKGLTFPQVNDDLSTTIVQDIALCGFDFPIPGPMASPPGLSRRIPGGQHPVEEVGRMGAGCGTAVRTSRRRLDPYFEKSLPNSIAGGSRLQNCGDIPANGGNTPAHNLTSIISSQETKRKFRTEDEEAVHYLVMKYLEP